MQRPQTAGAEHGRSAREAEGGYGEHQRTHDSNSRNRMRASSTVSVPTQASPVRDDQFDELGIVVVHRSTVLPVLPLSNPLHQLLSPGGVG